MGEEIVVEAGIKVCGVTGVESLWCWKGKLPPLQITCMKSDWCAVRFLHRINAETNDKIVLISNYTQTLDIFEKLCRSKK